MKKPLLLLLNLFFVVCLFSQNKSTTGWITLFDGKNTDAWRGYKMDKFPEGIWTVKNGAMETVTKTQNVDLITKERFKNFDLELEWAVDTAANSGIFFHIQEDKFMVFFCHKQKWPVRFK